MWRGRKDDGMTLIDALSTEEIDALIAYHIVFADRRSRDDFEICMDTRTCVYGDGGVFINKYCAESSPGQICDDLYWPLKDNGISWGSSSKTNNSVVSFNKYGEMYYGTHYLWGVAFCRAVLKAALRSEDVVIPSGITWSAPNYYEYIKSKAWRKKAETAKKRAGERCQVCNRSRREVQLDTHHRTYENLGHETRQDLIVLCHDCHELFEKNKKMRAYR